METIEIIDPDNRHPIPALWAFLSVDDQGNEGIVAARMAGEHFPLITGFEHLVPQMEALAKKTVGHTKKRIVLARFDRRVDLKEIKS